MKNIYLTAVTNERYLPGALALVRSLKEVKVKYDIAIMIPDTKKGILVPKLYEWGIITEGVFIVIKPEVFLLNSLELKDYYWKDTFFKIQAASCFEFDKIVLLDCDQMAVKNFDHLFDKPNMTSTTCGRCLHPDWVSLSSGMLVIEPTKNLYECLVKAIEPAIKWKYSEGKNAGDQDVFNYAFPDWRDKPNLYIPEKYNICYGMINALCDNENIVTKDFYMIHFPGDIKPWDKGKYHYFKILFSSIYHKDLKRLFYRIKIWRKYRRLCIK